MTGCEHRGVGRHNGSTGCRLPLALLGATLALLLTAAVAVARTVTLTQKDSGGHVTLKRGDMLQVSFTGSFSSTGYSWKLSTKPKGSVLKETNDYTVGGGCPAGVVGCPSTIVFVFKAEGRGRTHFMFHLLPPGRNAKPQGTFTQSVTVR